ncbi:hypothetical protein Slin15195_G100910 [Septoria linicola]|uniref:F-box domain-containing protein n=1 Tax=Septoria linicola TaxID=215465 RepID=A0A9Q9B3K6_9PEZI|nr:hypothetical protein Slin14017_G063930 [Septoria linicola]USW56772.1 hypothetical protein Slin15195_G100910 [Septoria linicola]
MTTVPKHSSSAGGCHQHPMGDPAPQSERKEQKHSEAVQSPCQTETALEDSRKTLEAVQHASHSSITMRESADEPGSAAEAVFGNAALLERILFKVDKLTLLHSMRVSRTFLDTIGGSRPLMRLLWMWAPRRPDRRFEPLLNSFLTHFRHKLGINGWIKRERGQAVNWTLRLKSKEELAKLGRGSWREMIIFRPNDDALGELSVHVETEDTPCVYDIFSERLDWSQTVKMGALVDMLV